MLPAIKSVETIYNGAVLLSSEEERAAYLDSVCGGDVELRNRVEALLRSYQDSSLRTAVDWNTPTQVTLGRPVPGEQAGDTLGRYKLLQAIGEGGFGIVYLAEQSEPVRRQVALKIIKAGMDTREVIGRFEAERQALAMMDHPNIARVFDAGATESGRPFFVMELVRGVPITQYCDDSQLGTEERLELFIAACEAVQHAHQKGIIHRDIKPSNVLVTTQSGRAAPKVIDFGIAKATQQPLTDKTVFTHAQQFIGTPAYMSPEQAGSSGLDIDTRSDIYSLGVLLYELLTGHTPFESKELLGAGYEDLRKNIREKDPPRPSTRLSTLAEGQRTTVARRRRTEPLLLVESLRHELDWVVMRALEKDRARRYESATAFAEDIRRYLNHEPVKAVAPSAGYRFKKFGQRHRGALAAAGAVTAALVLGIVLSLRQAVRATKNEQLANLQTEVANQATSKAVKQEAIAVAAVKQTKEVFSRSDFQIADGLLERNQDAQAVAHLTRALRSDPGNHAAAARLLMTLAQGNIISSPVVVRFPGDQDYLRPEGPGIGSRSTVSVDGNVIVLARGLEAYTYDGNGTAQGPALPLTSQVSSLAVSPDNQHLIVGMTNGVAEVWDLRTRLLTDRRFVAAPPSFGPRGGANPPPPPEPAGERAGFPVIRSHNCTAEFSDDGRKLAIYAVPEDMMGLVSVGVRDFASGELIASVETMQPLSPFVRFSHDGSWIAVTGADRGTNGVYWQSLTNKTTRFLPVGPRVMDMAITPDDKKLIMVADDPIVRIWDLETGTLAARHQTQEETLRRARLSPSGTRLVLNSGDSTVLVVDPATGQGLTPHLRHSHNVRRSRQGADPSLMVQLLDISPDGMKVATAAAHQLRIWSLSSGELLAGPVEISAGVLSRGQFSRDGSRLLVHFEGTVEIWPVATPAALPTQWHHEGFVSSQAMTSDGRRVATALADRTVRVWDLGSGRELFPPLAHPANVSLLTISADNSTLATVADTTVRVWDLGTGKPRSTMVLDSIVRELSLSRTGDRVLAKGSEFSRQQQAGTSDWRVWDSAMGTTLFEKSSRGLDLGSVKLSADGLRLAVEDGGEIQILELATQKEIGPRIQGQGMGALSPDGSRVVTVEPDRSALRIWDSVAAKDSSIAIPLRRGIPDLNARPLRFTPDGARLLVLDAERRISVYDVATGRMTAQPIRLGEAGEIEDISADGRFLLTSQVSVLGRSSRVWEIATGSALTQELDPGYQHFTADGRWLVGSIPRIRVFDLPWSDLNLPDWFLDFAESFAGLRFNEDGFLETIPGSARVKLARDLEGRTGAGNYVQWARWLASEPGRRSNSPFSVLSLDAFVENLKPVDDARAEDAWAGVLVSVRTTSLGSTNGLRRVLAQHPLHPLAMAEYGIQLSKSGDAFSMGEADWFTRRAAELAPASAAVARRRAEFLLLGHQNEEALAALRSGLAADPNSPVLRLLQARILSRLERLPEAEAALNGVIDRRDSATPPHRGIRERALHERALVRRAQGRIDEAQRDFLESKGIPPRTPEVDSELVNLSPFYNGGLDETCLPLLTGRSFEPMAHAWVGGNDLSALPRGRQKFGGADFDVRGLIQLAGSLLETNAPGKWPSAVNGIPIGRKARRLHVLLGVGTSRRMVAENDPSAVFALMAGMLPPVLHRQEVARFHIRLAGGAACDYPIRLNQEVHDVRLFHRDEVASILGSLMEPNHQAAWTGANPAGVRLALGRLTLDNPHPGRIMESLDFRSAMTEASPFLLAITVEPVSTDPAVLREEIRPLIREGTIESIGTAAGLSLEQTAAFIEEASRLNPADPASALHQGFLRVVEGKLESAVESFRGAVAKSGADGAHTPLRIRAVRHLTQTLMQLGRIDEARRFNLQAIGIPQRPSEATAAQIDLSLHCNAALTNSWMTPLLNNRNDLSAIAPLGLKKLGGVVFDVRGVVQLSGAQLVPTNMFPARVEGIQVAVRCGKLHFLHAAGWGDGPSGMPVGRYRIHYTDRSEASIELKVEEDLLDWWNFPGRSRVPRHSEVVWTGENDFARTFNAGIRLFKSTWANPRPETAIDRIDYESLLTPVAPFLVAITAE